MVKAKWLDAFGLDMDHTVLILQRALDQNKFAACDHHALPLIKIGSDDDIGDAGLIFHGEKNEALGRAWALPGDDTTGRAYIFAVFIIPQFR